MIKDLNFKRLRFKSGDIIFDDLCGPEVITTVLMKGMKEEESKSEKVT